MFAAGHTRRHTNDPSIKFRNTRFREIPGPTPHSVAVIAKPMRKEPVDKLILDRRMRDFQIGQAKVYLDEVKNCDVHMQWEKRNEKKIDSNKINQRINQALQTCEFELDDRRERLRCLLKWEDEEFTRLIEESQETTIERQAKMRERAKHLKEKRESNRLQVVHDKYEQRWRDQCEELRSLLSKRMTNDITMERNDQIREKASADAILKEDDKMYAQMWYDDIKSKADKEERQTRIQMESNNELVDILQKQMAAIEHHKERELAVKADEAALMREQDILRKSEEEQRLQEKRRSQAELRNMYDKSLKLKQAKIARLLQQELAFDMKQLETLLEITKNEALETSNRKAEMMAENQRYRDYLAYMKRIEIEQEKEIERLCDEEVERSWQKKIEKWQMERTQRKLLLSQVIAGRHQQVEAKRARIEAEKAATIREKEELMKVIEYNMQMERESNMKRKAEKVQHQSDVLGQIDYNSRKVSERVDEDRRIHESEMRARREYEHKLEDTLDRARNGLDELNIHPIRRHRPSAF